MGVDIRVENLNAWYGHVHTLQDINLHIPSNHATALIGPSGCGKSTFVRCLNRMHETNPIARAEGTVLMGGLAGADCDDYGGGDAGAGLREPRHVEGGKLSGSRHQCGAPERVVRIDAHAAGH